MLSMLEALDQSFCLDQLIYPQNDTMSQAQILTQELTPDILLLTAILYKSKE